MSFCTQFLRRARRTTVSRTRELCAATSLSPGWGTSKAGSLPGPGSATPPTLCPQRRGTVRRLGHVAPNPAAAKPKALPMPQTCRLREAIASAVMFASPPLSLSARAPELDSGRGMPQLAPGPPTPGNAAPVQLRPRLRQVPDL